MRHIDLKPLATTFFYQGPQHRPLLTTHTLLR